jgi:hypothetical protein
MGCHDGVRPRPLMLKNYQKAFSDQYIAWVNANV